MDVFWPACSGRDRISGRSLSGMFVDSRYRPEADIDKMKFLEHFLGRKDALRGVQEPLLTFNESDYFRVYTLTEALQADPDRVKKAQALTLNRDKPHMGLKGTYGLFGSPEWWDSINCRRMPLRFLSGTIVRLSEAGQDSKTGVNNAMVLKLLDGTEETFGIYVNNRKQVNLFQLGSGVLMVDALDELKRPQQNFPNDFGVMLEVAISRPISSS